MPTHDTTKSDESIANRHSLNGTDDTLVSVTVPDGEIWYVEGVHVTADGSGDTSGISIDAGIADAATLDNMMPTVGRAGRGDSIGVDTTVNDGASADVDAYASAGEEVRVVEAHEDGSTGGYHYSVQMRRVL
ncbi:hypothetical protein [Halorussus salinus]|uniref:hypothetical protein n=1 Tax=Halorussus salinus TaxID=1364935 RepID=UPI0010928C70|nr:hypothetical protein [Halorussus salinus]